MVREPEVLMSGSQEKEMTPAFVDEEDFEKSIVFKDDLNAGTELSHKNLA